MATSLKKKEFTPLEGFYARHYLVRMKQCKNFLALPRGSAQEKFTSEKFV
jgi:hypothetical protein